MAAPNHHVARGHQVVMPSRATLIALLALFVALGGPAEARKLINGKTIRPGTVASKQIKNRSLTTSDLSSRTISALRAKPTGSVGTAQLLDGSVTLSKLAPASVTGAQVADRSLSGVDLAAETLTANELAPNAVANAELANDAVSNAKLRTSSVTKGKIGSSDVGTEEIIDGDQRAADLGAFAGRTAPADFPSIPSGTCASGDFAVSPIRATTPAQDLSDDLVIVGQPPQFPGDTVTLSGRPAGPGTLRLTACNAGTTEINPEPVAIPYLSIAP